MRKCGRVYHIAVRCGLIVASLLRQFYSQWRCVKSLILRMSKMSVQKFRDLDAARHALWQQ